MRFSGSWQPISLSLYLFSNDFLNRIIDQNETSGNMKLSVNLMI